MARHAALHDLGRGFLAMAYWCSLGLGCLQTWEPSNAVAGKGELLGRLWGLSLIVGSVFCIWSVARNTWPGEYTGSFTLSLAFFLYSLGVFTTPPYTVTHISVGLILLAIALLLQARFKVLSGVRKMRAAEAVQRNMESEGGD